MGVDPVLGAMVRVIGAADGKAVGVRVSKLGLGAIVGAAFGMSVGDRVRGITGAVVSSAVTAGDSVVAPVGILVGDTTGDIVGPPMATGANVSGVSIGDGVIEGEAVDGTGLGMGVLFFSITAYPQRQLTPMAHRARRKASSVLNTALFPG